MHAFKYHVYLPIHLTAYLLAILRLMSGIAFRGILVSIRRFSIINIVKAGCDDHYAYCCHRC